MSVAMQEDENSPLEDCNGVEVSDQIPAEQSKLLGQSVL
jgi:hypothetical protein